jgi:hypothetical protein
MLEHRSSHAVEYLDLALEAISPSFTSDWDRTLALHHERCPTMTIPIFEPGPTGQSSNNDLIRTENGDGGKALEISVAADPTASR